MKKILATIYIEVIYKLSKSLQQNELIHDFQIDHIEKLKLFLILLLLKLPNDLENIKSIKNRKDLL